MKNLSIASSIFYFENVEGQTAHTEGASESEQDNSKVAKSDQLQSGMGLSAPTCSRFVYSVEAPDGSLIDEVTVHAKMVPARFMVKYVHQILGQISEKGYFNESLKFSARVEPDGESFSEILTKRTDSPNLESTPSSSIEDTPLSDKKEVKSSNLDSGQKNPDSVSENTTSLDRGSEGSRSKESDMFFNKVVFCEND